ncbi:MAG TPA: RluA family pseudouridine synthase [Acidisoma sp.]|uniref:RluA family pseudouridine synthase n=1 Tax=Acidisoma sp. TaxID=1872115 RepID=UPI002C210C21|nr:RluA family pseudouridine synthase [Acidisoma sp.]HTI01142.1 RluA family pseudouridine synthase [Acidisoma sp.]
MSAVEERTVTEDEADIRLDRWFRRHFPGLTQGAISKLCRTGQIRVAGRRSEANTRLQPGQAVRIPPPVLAVADTEPPRPETVVDARLVKDLERMVIYRDDWLIVLNKPPGLATQGGPGITKHLDGMLDGLRGDMPVRPRLVHRLDRDTSGVLLLARTPGMAAKLAASFRTRTVEKTYWAIVKGLPVPLEGLIDQPLTRVQGLGGARSAIAHPSDPDSQKAVTEYETLDHAGRKFSWLGLHPQTGRTHQLRVHCSAMGNPILGDVAYGGESEMDTVTGRLHLHARALKLPHPAGGTLTVAAPLPAHMEETFRQLGFVAPALETPRWKR